MPKTILPEQIALIRKYSGKKTKRELAFQMGLTIAQVSSYYLSTKSEPYRERAPKTIFDVFEYRLEDNESPRKKKMDRPKAVYTQNPSPYGIADQLHGKALVSKTRVIQSADHWKRL